MYANCAQRDEQRDHEMSATDLAKNPWRIAVTAIVLALVLSGCGRKGALELPPNAAQPPQDQAVERSTEVPPEEPVQPPANANRPFILDWLI